MKRGFVQPARGDAAPVDITHPTSPPPESPRLLSPNDMRLRGRAYNVAASLLEGGIRQGLHSDRVPPEVVDFVLTEIVPELRRKGELLRPGGKARHGIGRTRGGW